MGQLSKLFWLAYFYCKFCNWQYNNINIVVFKMVGGNGMSDVNNLLENAVIETKNVLPGEKFLLRDLFKGYEPNLPINYTQALVNRPRKPA